jgi:hypothetical protein
LMKHLRAKDVDMGKKIPGFRFNTYRTPILPKPEDWKSSTKEILRLCLEASFRQTPPGDKKERARLYEETRKCIGNEIPNAGSLITNHLMAVFAIVGLVPLWYAEEYTVDTSSKSFKFLVKNKGLVKGKPAADRFLESLSSSLKTEHGVTVSRKYSENVCCKAFRIENDRLAKEAGSNKESSDHRFSDLIFHNQCIFEVVGGQVHVHRKDFETVVVNGGLIDRWAMGGRVWTLSQLILQFESTAKDVFFIPKELGLASPDSHVPKWVNYVFPKSFVVSQPNEIRAVVLSLLKN